MKKMIALALALCLAFALVSCGESTDSSMATSSVSSSGGFVKPEQYATVLLVTINPQFRLYLDENGKVLAVEAVNKDAESFKDSISFENQNFETVIESIVTSAQKNGFVKEDATINFEIVESQQTDQAALSDILSKAEKTANDTADALKIDIKVTVAEVETANDASSSATAVTSNTPSSSVSAHTHSFSAATCTEPKKCACGAVEGTALGHDYKDGVCTRCQAKDPNYKPTSVLSKQGKWTSQYLNGKELNSVSIIVCKAGANSANVGIGDPLSSLPPDMQNDPEIKKYCEMYNGVNYYIGRGTGDDIKSVTEEDNTVTLTDSSGKKLVLTRTGENTIKCASAPDTFAYISGIPAGAVFTFVAE